MSYGQPGVPPQTAYLNSILQRSRGITARYTGGNCCSVFRTSPASPPTGVMSGQPILTGYVAKFERTTRRDDLENELFDLLTFIAKMDASPLKFGDLILEIPTGTVYAYVQSRVTGQNIVVRCEASAIVKRPVDVPKRTADATPSTGPRIVSANDHPTETTVDEPSADVLVLRGGRYSFAPADPSPIPCVIPIGAQPTSRARPGHKEGLPTSTDVERFIGYIPPIGVLLRDNDLLELQDSSGIIYTIEQVYQSGNAGTLGTTALMSKAYS